MSSAQKQPAELLPEALGSAGLQGERRWGDAALRSTPAPLPPAQAPAPTNRCSRAPSPFLKPQGRGRGVSASVLTALLRRNSPRFHPLKVHDSMAFTRCRTSFLKRCGKRT